MAARARVARDEEKAALDQQLADGLPHLLLRNGFRSFGEFEKHLNDENITVSMWRVILLLNAGGKTRIGDLAEPASLEPSTVSRAVKKLERLGYLTRERSELDERVVGVKITPAGRALVRRVQPLSYAIERRMIVNLTQAEVETLKGLLRRLNTASLAKDVPTTLNRKQ